jgi:NADPH-dependent ferric siderophore reductase
MTSSAPEPAPGRRGGPPRSAEVLSAERLSPNMVRIVFGGPEVAELDPDAVFADGYVKLLFSGAMRTYTIRALADGEMTIDFVVHGDEGLAGPWAASAAPGDTIEFRGPGGEWSPRTGAHWHLFIGDESALPAIASGLDRLLVADANARALVFAEVASAEEHYPLAEGPHVHVTWVHRDGDPYGANLVDAVLEAELPQGDPEAFVHGNADMVRPLRRYLLGERGLPREQLSVSGYWRVGLTDEGWRAVKRDFNEAMERDAAV